MRIIGGEFRSRRILSPADATNTRPMPDRVREAVFNLLRGHTQDEPVADVFAGTGSIGLEALSRGASSCLFVERDRTATRLLRQNIESLGVADRAEIVPSDALGSSALAACPDPVHLVFFDPPYAMMRDPDQRSRLLEQLARFIARLDDTGFAVLRTPRPLPPTPDEAAEGVTAADLIRVPSAKGPETHPYGTTAVHLYMRSS